ncbi:UNVERIFIED_CONTAM: hypothetical protein BEN50_14545 [Euhalothece sp. KZN 001]
MKRVVRSQVKSPAYRVILAIANYNRGLLLIAFNGNLLSAIFEGSTFGVIYVALRVLEEGSLANMNRLNWLEPFVGGWSQGQLFIGLISLAIVMQFLRSGLSYVGLVSSGYLKARVRAQMTEQVFRRIMSLSFPCASGYKVGDLTQYVQSAQGAVNTELEQWNRLFVNTFVIISYVAVLIAISPFLSVVAVILGVGLILVQRYLIPRIKANSREVTQATVSVIKQIVESIQGLRLIHSFGRQRETIGQVHQLTGALVPLIQKQERLIKVTQPLNQALTITTVGILLILGFIVLNNEEALLIPALFTFIAALNRLSAQLGAFAGIMNALANNSGNMDRLNEILITEDKEWSRVGGKVFEGLKEKIYFEEVTLRYFSDQAPALKNVDFVMPKGSVTALVGGSGAGKSSLADLLTGLYDPSEGRVLIDQIDLREYSLESWRKQMGVVSQDTFIFNQPIIENIRYGKPEATETEVIEAAKDAQAHEFIMALPQGYDTIVGERGYRLSGGQRQRLALARAILKQPEILILDEATSALDSQSEQLVQQALAMFQKDRTVLVVAHRLSTITGADQILVLEQGEIIERGTHQGLLNQGGRYADYWQLQAQGQAAVT